jgi:Tol biopolymer transport system component
MESVRRIFLPLLAAIVVIAPGQCIQGSTQRISIGTFGEEGDSSSAYAAASEDGRFVAFSSSANNFTALDFNNASDVFIRDQVTGETFLVSSNFMGIPGNGASDYPAISSDGRFIAFVSSATDLVPDDTNGKPDVFVRDMSAGVTIRVSVATDGSQADSTSYAPSMSSDGRYVAFRSDATNLVVPADTEAFADIFVHDIVTGQTEKISTTWNKRPVNGKSDDPFISANGRYVVYVSAAYNLVKQEDHNLKPDIFFYDRGAKKTERISITADGTEANGQCFSPSVTANGRFVAFSSVADNLDGPDTNAKIDVFVKDRETGEVKKISHGLNGEETNNSSLEPTISADGLYIAYYSYASNIVPNDKNDSSDVFLYYLESGKTEIVSVSSAGVIGDKASGVGPVPITAGGRFVLFHSAATNLVPNDDNNHIDVFLHELPVPYTHIRGKISFTNLVPSAPRPDFVEFRMQYQDWLFGVYRATVGDDGSYEISLPPGFYRITFKAWHWLRDAWVLNTTVGDVDNADFELINGDVDGDNSVTLKDVSAVFGAWGTGSPNADLNGDGGVDIKDISIVFTNFGIVGQGE